MTPFTTARVLAIPLLAALLIGLIIFSLGLGLYPISPARVVGIIFAESAPFVPIQHTWTNTDEIVVAIVRLPRILVAALAGPH